MNEFTIPQVDSGKKRECWKVYKVEWKKNLNKIEN